MLNAKLCITQKYSVHTDRHDYSLGIGPVFLSGLLSHAIGRER